MKKFFHYVAWIVSIVSGPIYIASEVLQDLENYLDSKGYNAAKGGDTNGKD